MKKMALMFVLLSVALAFAACQKGAAKLTYPVTKKVDQVDNYFGTVVADPYRWLEDDNAEEVKLWVVAQNAVTSGYLNKIPFRPKIKARLTEIFNYPRYSSPFRAGENYFFYKNDGLQNQSICYIQKGLDGTPEVFLDPNLLSTDGTVRASLIGASNDDRYVAVSRGEAGSDWFEIRVMEISTKQELSDRVQWVKFSGAAWNGDGFFYSGYDRPAPGEELKAKNEYQKVLYHKLGDPQEKDTLVWEDKEHPLRYVGAGTTEDEKVLFLVVSEGTSGSELYYKDLTKKDAAFSLLVKGFAYDSSPIEVVNGKVLVLTNEDAPNFRLVLVDPKNPAKETWQTVIAEKPEVLSGAGTAGGYLFTNYLKDANSKIFQHKLDGSLIREIELPALGSAGGFGGKRDEKTLFYTFTSFTYPPTIYKFDPATGTSQVFRTSEVKFNPADYETKQVFFASKDGTRVPMFIVHKKGLVLDGKNPTFLTAYGGFNLSVTPAFSAANIVLLENGGVFAEANLRGGGEYGESWHKAGMLGKKQNVFDDFIAAAEYLVKEKYTSKDRLAIAGGSNGGLLVGAVMTQRPELFGVAFPAVGVMDMLR
ncbi:MAG: S9 family peptidase, partial [Candidatus Aminicenantes bacterium]|nr:S9 family peptidase [Candidatus Aminicenantes bacterium]